jgi:hypothetical protein
MDYAGSPPLAGCCGVSSHSRQYYGWGWLTYEHRIERNTCRRYVRGTVNQPSTLAPATLFCHFNLRIHQPQPSPFGCPVKCLIEGKRCAAAHKRHLSAPITPSSPGCSAQSRNLPPWQPKRPKQPPKNYIEYHRIPAMPRPLLGSQPPLVLGQGRKGREEKRREGEGEDRSQRYSTTIRYGIEYLRKYSQNIVVLYLLSKYITVLNAVRAHQAHGTRALLPVQKNRRTDGSHRQRREKECKDIDQSARSNEKRGKAFADRDPRRDSG